MSMLRPSLNQLMTKNESCYSVVVGKQSCCLTDVSLLKFHLTIP